MLSKVVPFDVSTCPLSGLLRGPQSILSVDMDLETVHAAMSCS